MSRLTFNMSLDILEGCKYSCVDCAVDRDYIMQDIPKEDVDALINLAHEMRTVHNAEMFEFSIGPTDFITSENGMGILKHPLVSGLIKEFDSLVIVLSMLSDHRLVELAKQLDEHAPGKKFRLGIPITIKNAYNEKYLDMLRRHIAILKDNMTECEFYRIYSTVVMTGETLELFDSDVVYYMSMLKLGVWQTPEWLFGHSRARFDDIITHNRFKHDYKTFIYKMSSMRGDTHYVDVVPDPNDGIEVTYRNGKLYYLPYLIEKFHWWHDALEIPKSWTADNIIAKKNEIVTDNMIDEHHSEDCVGCCHFFNCNTGDVKTVMRLLGETKCLPGVRNRIDLALKQRPEEYNRRDFI